MHRTFLLLACVLIYTLHLGAAVRADSSYKLEIRKDKNDPDDNIARLINVKTGRTVWTCPTQVNAEIVWSKNRRALAIEGEPREIYVWVEGYRLRNFFLPGSADGLFGWAWSADNRTLLLRTTKSGDRISGEGSLYCMQLRKWPYYKCALISMGVGEMGWHNRRTIKYRKMRFYNRTGSGSIDKKWSYWKVPW
jgi:hypothetical protein